MKILSPPTADPSSGFTLLEVIIVLAIISLGAALVVPAISTAAPQNNANAVRDFVAKELGRARLEGRTVVVVADDKHVQLGDAAFSLPDNAVERFEIEVSQSLEKLHRIVAYPDGRIAGGTLVLIQADGRQRTMIGIERSGS